MFYFCSSVRFLCKKYISIHKIQNVKNRGEAEGSKVVKHLWENANGLLSNVDNSPAHDINDNTSTRRMESGGCGQLVDVLMSGNVRQKHSNYKGITTNHSPIVPIWDAY